MHLKCGTGQCPPVSCAQGIALHIVPRRCHGEGQALGVLIRNAAVAGWGDLSHAQRCDGRGDVAREPTRGNRPAPGPGAPCSRLRPRARCAGRSHDPLPVRPSPPETVTYFITLRNTRAKDAAPQTKHRYFRSEARHSQTALGFKLELAQTHPDEPALSRERLGRSVVSELHSCGGSSRANLGYEANHSRGRPQKHLLCVHCHMGQRPGGQELSAPRHVEAESDRDVVAVQLVRKNSGVRRGLSHSGAWSSLSPPGDSGTHSYDTK